MNQDYRDGREAREQGLGREACPFSHDASVTGAPPQVRNAAQLTRRHWWLAGWHDRDIEIIGRTA